MASEAFYLVIYNTLKNNIRQGMYGSGKLPSEREIIAELGGSRIMVREALMRLEREGITYRLSRRGWFVAPPRIKYSPHLKSHFNRIATAQGRKPKSLVLHSECYEPDPHELEQKGMGFDPSNARLNHIKRLRLLDNQPVLHEQIWINAYLTEGLLDHPLDQSLTELMLKEYQLKIDRVDVHINVAPMEGEQAKELLVREGTMGLKITQKRYDQYGNLLEYDIEHWRHDVIELELKFSSS